MNEYEKVLFNYIMDKKMSKTLKRLDYLLADERERAILKELDAELTADQRRQFGRYEEQTGVKALVDLEQMFTETLTAVRMLLASGQHGG